MIHLRVVHLGWRRLLVTGAIFRFRRRSRRWVVAGVLSSSGHGREQANEARRQNISGSHVVSPGRESGTAAPPLNPDRPVCLVLVLVTALGSVGRLLGLLAAIGLAALAAIRRRLALAAISGVLAMLHAFVVPGMPGVVGMSGRRGSLGGSEGGERGGGDDGQHGRVS
ncbi:MAG TPA: hypothetical protein VM913_01535 [Sphingomicrobium sp.]|jgi:hypothetical protein|nr:hypothetical protein [Sphingomicrobium sp.]